MKPNDLGRLDLFQTPDHECAYLSGRVARTVFADPDVRPDRHVHTVMASYGFRRSGRFIYRPNCPGCRACVPVRIPVERFHMTRSQKRTWRKNQDLQVSTVTAKYKDEYFSLYNHYQAHRHPDGVMEAKDPQTFLDFLTSEWSDTYFYEFRADDTLIAVCAADPLDNGLSAVYTFFHPAYEKRSLGTHAILHLIHEARRYDLKWVYLGYWIQECAKMSYKNRFRPLQVFRDGRWVYID
ncbi:MAG: arginyltransferase [Gammaproteobacteria bacterium]|nr:arginyltransferase [Gammaproteobacteria bacterium]